MADNEEIIGGIGVTIGADYSSLQAAFATAQGLAQQAGENIADALQSGAESGADVGQEIASSLDQITPAADGASGSLTEFSDSTQTAGESADTADSSLASMAQNLTAIGEALAITEGLREFGATALEASDSITRASISLTTMTGSADTARETIEQLEALGMADGLAMPSLLTAAQRMTALLPAGTDVVSVLSHVADGAAAMGASIDEAANRFDMIVNAGTLSSRALTSMGLSLQSVTDALNVVSPAANATTSSVTAMFKALDPGDRVAVLEQALSHLGGTAEQVAQQTFGGQWQQLANAWEKIMVDVGQALLPVITDLLDFTKTDIVPFIQGLVSAFNEAPGPIKDTAVAVGLVAAALIPVTGVAAAAAIGISGLGEALELLGLKSGESAIAQDAEAAASVAQGAAAAEAAPEVAALGEASEAGAVSFGLLEAGGLTLAGVIGVTLVAGLAAAAFGFTDLQASIKSAQDQWAQGAGFKDAAGFISAANIQIEQQIKDLATAALTTEDAAKAEETFERDLALGVISGAQFAEALKNITAAENNLKFDELSTLSQQFASGLTIVSSTAAKATDNISLLSQVLANAKTNFDATAAGYEKGTKSAQEYLSAQNALTTAQNNLNAAMGPAPGSMQAITDAATKLANAGGVVVSSEQEQANEQAVAVSSMDLATKAYNASVIALDSYVSQLHDAQAADDGTVAAQAAVTTAEGNVQKAYAASQKDLGDLTKTLQNYISYMNGSGASTQAEINLLQDLADKFGPATAKALGLTDQIAALQKQLNAPIVGMPDALAGLQSALTETTNNVHKLAGEMAAGLAVGTQYEKALTAQLNAQIAVDQETAVLATGLQGTTDAQNLATIAVAEAKAKYDDLVTAWQSGMPVLSQLQSAQKALTAAQNELNTATGTGISLTNQLDAAYPNLATATNTATNAFQNQATQLETLVQDLQSVGAAVQAVEDDFSSAFGSSQPKSGSSGGSISAPAGYTGVVTFSAGTLGGLSETLTWVPTQATIDADNKAAAQQLYDAGYTPTAIAKSMATTVAIVCGWLGVDISTAAQPKGAAGSTGAVLLSTQQAPTITTAGGTLSAGGTTTAGGTPVAASSGGGGTSAIDGGSYPAVTAHQAAGEVWAVSTSGASSGGVSSGGNINEQISTVVNQTSTGGSAGLQQVAGAIGGAVQTLAINGQSLSGIAQSLASTSAATQQLATAVAGLVQRIQTGTGSGTTAQGGGGATIAYGGTPYDAGYSPNPAGLPYANNPNLPTAGAAGPTSTNTTVTANINVTGANNPTQVAQQVASVLVSQLRTAGARF